MSPLICDHCGAEDYDPQNQNLPCVVCDKGHMRDDLSSHEMNLLNMKQADIMMREVWDHGTKT